MNTSSIILSPYQTKILGKFLNTGNHQMIDEILFSFLLNDKVYIFSHLINERNFKNFELLKKYGLIEYFPSRYLESSFNNLRFHFNNQEDLELRESRDEYKRRFFSADEDIFTMSDDDKVNIHGNDELINSLLKSEETKDNIYFSKNLFYDQNIELQNFVRNFRESKSNLSNKVFEDFSLAVGISPLISYINSGLTMQSESYKHGNKKDFSLSFLKENLENHWDSLEQQFENVIDSQLDYISLNNLKYTQPDSIPSIKYINDYIDLISSKLLLDASLNFAFNESVSIQMKINNEDKLIQNKNPNTQLVNQDDNSVQIYKLLIEKINFPKIQNAESLLRLRENKNILKFRKQVDYWNEALWYNDIKNLEKIKSYLVKANKGLERVEIRNKSDWVFYTSIPVGIIGALIKLPLSLGPLAVTGAIKLDNYRIKRKYNWVINQKK